MWSRARGSMGGYRRELSATAPLQGSSPSHPRPPATVAIHDSVRQAIAVFFFGEADFFSAKRLFFRAARDVSGVRSNPLWARVVIKLKMSFQALSHSSSHERASVLTSPPPDFFISFIPQNPSQNPPKIQNPNKSITQTPIYIMCTHPPPKKTKKTFAHLQKKH